MTNDDEKAAVLACNEWAREDYRRDLLPAHVFEAGFRAGLAHARRWRPLTSDEATWPTTGQWVLLYDGRVTDDDAGTEWNADSVAIALGEGWTHWLPLPPPSEEDGR